MEDKKGKVLITGAGGFLGKHLVEEFLKQGFDVRATDLPSSDLSFVKLGGGEIVHADLLDPPSLEKAVEGVDFVVHNAAAFNLALPKKVLYAINVTGTENICAAVIKAGIKHFIQISTADAYGPCKTIPAKEDHPFKPANRYALTKAQAEDVVVRYGKEHGLNYSIIRPSVIYGPGSIYIAQALFPVPAILRFLGIKSIPFLIIKGGFGLNLSHAEDIAGAAAFMTGKPEAFSQAYNVCDTESITTGELLELLFSTYKIRIKRPLPQWKCLIALIGYIGLILPSFLTAGIYNWLQNRVWKKIAAKYNLRINKYRPNFDKGLFSYFIGHHVYDTSKIKQLGYKLRYHSYGEELPNIIKWYIERKYLPPIPID